MYHVKCLWHDTSVRQHHKSKHWTRRSGNMTGKLLKAMLNQNKQTNWGMIHVQRNIIHIFIVLKSVNIEKTKQKQKHHMYKYICCRGHNFEWWLIANVHVVIIEHLTFATTLHTWTYQAFAFSYCGEFQIYDYSFHWSHRGEDSLPRYSIM